MNPYPIKYATPAGILCFMLVMLSGSPAVFSQGVGDMNLDGNVHNAYISTEDTKGFHTYTIPNQPGKFLYLEAIGGDGGKREYTSFSTCTKEGGQGAFVSAWFGIGENGLLPGGKLRTIPGKKGTDARGSGIEGAGGGGGSGIAYLPPGSDAGNPENWKLLMVAGGGGGAASSGVCAGSSGMPGQVTTSGEGGNGSSPGSGGSNGEGGKDGFGIVFGTCGSGGGGWKSPGNGDCKESSAGHYQYGIDGTKYYVYAGGGYSGSGKDGGPMTGNGMLAGAEFWVGGPGGATGQNGPGNRISGCDGNFNGGGFGFGGGGSGDGSGGGGGGYSGGGGGGAVGITGGGGGGGGGSYVNNTYAEPLSTVMHQRGTTSSPVDGSISYKFSATSPVVSCELGLAAHKGQMVKILHTGDWTLQWQYDGNLVLYQSGVAKWASGTNNKGTDLYFQGDGNLVIYQANVGAIWASNTANDEKGGKGGRKMVLTSDGHLFIIDQDGKKIWTGH